MKKITVKSPPNKRPDMQWAVELIRDYEYVLSAYKGGIIDLNTAIWRLFGASELWLVKAKTQQGE